MTQRPPNPFAELFDDPEDFEAEAAACDDCGQHVAECLCGIDDDFAGEWEE